MNKNETFDKSRTAAKKIIERQNQKLHDEITGMFKIRTTVWG